MSAWTIDAIEIGGGFLEGLSVRLPSGLTCIIGPRGSGKSTLAEAARYVLSGNTVLPKARADLLQANLGGGVVSVRTGTDARGEAWIIRRQYKQPANLASSTGRVVANVDLERGTFLPIDAYASAEIEAIADEALGDRRRALLDDLIIDELRALQAVVSDQRRALEANAEHQKSSQRDIQGVTERIEELRDPRARLGALPPAPPDSTSAALLAASRQDQVNTREVANIATTRATLNAFTADLDRVLTEHALGNPLVVDGSANAGIMARADAELRSFAERTSNALASIQRDAAVCERALVEIGISLQSQQATQALLFTELQQRNAAASEAARARAAVEAEVGQLIELERQREEARGRSRELANSRKRLKVHYLGERSRISQLRRDVADRLQRELGNRVRMLVIANADLQAYQQTLVKGLHGARVRNHEDILEALLRIAPDQLAQIIRDNDAEEFERLCSFGSERSTKILGAFRDNVDPFELELVAIEDQIRIELNVAPGGAEHFKDASELSRGQKCTALLPLLLARRHTPLIIDQPEDNLDNHFIYETVVDSIRRQKLQRQMIFITHNANIPVLGEADLVIVMDSDGRRGSIRKAGSVDQCRAEIIDLLEGGEEAFELRRQRYAKQ